MAIIQQNPSKLYIKVDDYSIIEEIDFLIKKYEYACSVNIYNQYEYVFQDKKGFKTFRENYNIVFSSRRFLNDYRNGKYDHLFDKNEYV